MKRYLLAFISLAMLLGACGSTEIAGISDEDGCGIFENNFDVFVQVFRDECPFDLTLRFTIEHDGCNLTYQDAGPNGENLPGVINQQGFYGVEITDGGTIYECQGDAVTDSNQGFYRLDCEYDDGRTCRIDLDPL